MKQRTMFRATLGVLAIMLAPIVAMADCGAPKTCADATDSLSGELSGNGIVLRWDTNSENGNVAYYKVKRYDCADPTECSVTVDIVVATGSCGQTEQYSLEDDPPTPYDAWTYTLEVWRTNSSRRCAVDIVPE